MPTRADETNFKRFTAGAVSGEQFVCFFSLEGLVCSALQVR